MSDMPESVYLRDDEMGSVELTSKCDGTLYVKQSQLLDLMDELEATKFNLQCEKNGFSEISNMLLTTNNKLTMSEAMQAGDSVIINEQSQLLRECRYALDDLIKKKKGIESLLCGSTTLGNLKAQLYKYRPKAVMNDQHNSIGEDDDP